MPRQNILIKAKYLRTKIIRKMLVRTGIQKIFAFYLFT